MSNPAASAARVSSLQPATAAIATSTPKSRKRSIAPQSAPPDAVTPLRRSIRESPVSPLEEDPYLIGNADFGTDLIRAAGGGDRGPEKTSLARASNRTTAQALESASLPTRPKVAKSSSQAKRPKGAGGISTLGKHLLSNVISRPFVAFVVLAGLATTLWSWRSHQPPHPASMEVPAAHLESLTKTAKMIQVQLDLVDMKIRNEIESLKSELEEKIALQATSFGTELRDVKAKTEDIERSLSKLVGDGFPTRQDVHNLIRSVVEERTADSNGEALGLDDVRAVARRLIEVELEKHAADGIGRVDYALSTGGGKVVHHSEGFYQGLGTDWRQLLPGATHKHSLANKILEPSFGEPGQCLPLKGSNVFVEIALRTHIFPEAFSLEHVSKSAAYDISSAPQVFRVLGWLDSFKKEDAAAKPMTQIILGEFVYDVEKKSVQTFPVQQDLRQNLINMVRLEILSNYGSTSHTCIYRFRVHGSDSKEALWF